MPESLSIRDALTETRVFSQRAVIAAVIVLLVGSALGMRYFHLQVIDHERYRTESDRNRIHARPVPPRRGLIFDRNGEMLADNRPIFNLMVTRERVQDVDDALADIGSIIDIDADDRAAFRKRLRRSLPFEGVPLRFNLSEEEIAKLAVDRFRLPGVEVEAELVRHYPHGPLLAHAIGYVGRINEAELVALDTAGKANDYNGTNLIGKNGVERFYEDDLHGGVGYENVETNARGRVLRVLEHTDPGPGLDLTLELDLRVQRAAYEALGTGRGAVVAIDPRTGGILALASTPAFDPNPFVSGIGAAAYAELRDSPDHPLVNRAIQGMYPPGSTIKPMYGLGGLYWGESTPQTAFSDPGFYRLGGAGRKYRDWKKWGHGGAVNLSQAITESCDVYFYNLAHQVGIERMHDFAQMFSLGKQTGVDLTAERAGIMPSNAWKVATFGQPWYPGETISAGIGQGYVLATPLQLAVMTATIANRGRHFRPHLIARIGDRPIDPDLLHTVEMPDPAYWDTVFAAMQAVVHSPRGTAKLIAKDLPYHIAGKTGTAQVVGIGQNENYKDMKLDERQRDHALFMAFAPVEDPRIAVAVIVENGEHGGSAAAPVARKVMDAWLLPPGTPESLTPTETIAGIVPLAQPAVAAPVIDADTALPIGTASASPVSGAPPATPGPASGATLGAPGPAPRAGDQSG